MLLNHEAEKCRQKARAFVGKPEAPFLLNIADAFAVLAQQERAQAARINRLRDSQ